jgi:hypothetical protein
MLTVIIVLLVVDIVIHLIMADSRKNNAGGKNGNLPPKEMLPAQQPSQTEAVTNIENRPVPIEEDDSTFIEDDVPSDTPKHSLTTLEEVKNTFTLNEMINVYQSGELSRWLLKIGDFTREARLREFNIPMQGMLSKEDKLKLCEIIFPNWLDLPGRIQQAIDNGNYLHEKSFKLTEEEEDKIWRCLSKVSQSRISVQSNDSECLVSYNNHVCFVTKSELKKLLHENRLDEIGSAVNRFFASEPLCMAGRDLGYVIGELTEYIFNVTRFYYDTNARQITYRPEMSSAIMFNDSQPMSNPHMVTITGNRNQLYPSYQFDKEQLKSLIGLSRIDIASKILGWLNEAHLFKKTTK